MKRRVVNQRSKPRHLEEAEQMALMDWARYRHFKRDGHVYRLDQVLFAIPNGGRRNAREAQRLKKAGVRAGVSDLILTVPSRGFCGLWIEMKKPLDKFRSAAEAARAFTPAQVEFMRTMMSLGYLARGTYGMSAAARVILHYLEPEPVMGMTSQACIREGIYLQDVFCPEWHSWPPNGKAKSK